MNQRQYDTETQMYYSVELYNKISWKKIENPHSKNVNDEELEFWKGAIPFNMPNDRPLNENSVLTMIANKFGLYDAAEIFSRK